MPNTDTIPPALVDVRQASSEWLVSCPVHGPIRMGIQFNGLWARTYCADCFEDWLPTVAELMVIDPNGNPPPEGLVSSEES